MHIATLVLYLRIDKKQILRIMKAIITEALKDKIESLTESIRKEVNSRKRLVFLDKRMEVRKALNEIAG